MSTVGQFSTKNTTIKRILKEVNELSTKASPDFHAGPLENDLFEWHFTLRGPPAPSPFENGLYHGRIILPAAYPMKPPSFRFLTPTGRFEVNREICLSISGHHEETWQPAWGIRTALVAIRSFMDTDARGQLGGMEASEEVRRRFAAQSKEWKCGTCGKTNEAIMQEQKELAGEDGLSRKDEEEEVPEELRLAYREDLGTDQGSSKKQETIERAPESAPTSSDGMNTDPSLAPAPTQQQPQQPPATVPQIASHREPVQQQAQLNQPRRQPPQAADVPPWIDKAIYGILAALVYLLFRKFT